MRYKFSQLKSLNSSLACEIDFRKNKPLERLFAKVLQYLIWWPAQISEYVIVFLRRI